MRRRPRVSSARLRELLHYDPETGEFHWRKRLSRRIRADGIAGGRTNDGYWRSTIDGRYYQAHQLAWFYRTGKWCRQVIDHRDGDPSNNRWDNLRRATLSQSNANRRPCRNNACGLKGVSRDRQRWRATIYKNGRRHPLGNFPTPEAAHAAYAKAARKLFGEFARTE